MAEFKIDSWNAVQLDMLRTFFREKAKPGDTVIFDRRLAESNAPTQEGIGDDGCNSWVFRAANMALEGMEPDKIKKLADTVTLTTAYLHAQYPEPVQTDTPKVDTDTALEEEADLDLDFDWPEPEDEGADPEAEEWAAVVASYQEREIA